MFPAFSVLLGVLASLATLQPCLATCYVGLEPSPNFVCNAAPDTAANVELIFILMDVDLPTCQDTYAAAGDHVSQVADITYTGSDGVVRTTSAVDTVTDIVPQITGTYSFLFDVPHTIIKDGSVVTQQIVYNAPGYPSFGTVQFSYVETHVPTLLYTVATSTVTYPDQQFTLTTSTSTQTQTTTVTPATATSTIASSTKTVKAKNVVTTTITVVPTTRTIYKESTSTITSTVTCISAGAAAKVAQIRGRQQDSSVLYSAAHCGLITTTTLTISTAIVLQPSPTTITETAYATTTTITTQTAATPVVFKTTITTVTSTSTATKHTTLKRQTTTSTLSFIVTKWVVPRHTTLGGCGEAPQALLAQHGKVLAPALAVK